MIHLTFEQFHELLRLDPATGELWWRHREAKWFKGKPTVNSWNTRYANKPALNNTNTQGYLAGSILGKQYSKHRVVFFMCFGYWPIEVDHDDRNILNNSISNLFDRTKTENQRNKSLQINSTTGAVGVSYHKHLAKYRAYIKDAGRQISLGYFDQLNDAIASREAASRQFNFHPNHGITPL